MPAPMIALTALSAALLVGTLVVYVLPYIGDGGRAPVDAVPAGDILHRVAVEHDECHRSPTVPYTVGEAHEVFRDRIDCSADRCGAKRAAYWALVDAGKIRPDERAALR